MSLLGEGIHKPLWNEASLDMNAAFSARAALIAGLTALCRDFSVDRKENISGIGMNQNTAAASSSSAVFAAAAYTADLAAFAVRSAPLSQPSAQATQTGSS